MTLRQMREASGLTQEQAAERAKMSQPSISALELGRVANPGIETVAKLAEVYGQTLETVLAAIREAA
jgi:transcriptional regulator with XRE-family HTH domain